MKLLRPLSLAGIFIFTPIAFSADGAVQINEACALGGSCCTEQGSTCVIDGKVTEDAHYSSKGCIKQH